MGGGGGEKAASLLVREWSRSGRRVDLVLMDASGPFMQSEWGSVRIHNLNCGPLRALPALTRFIRSQRPDVLVTFMPLANGLAGLVKTLAPKTTLFVGVEQNERSLALGDTSTFKQRGFSPFLRLGYRNLDGLIAVSTSTRVRLIQEGICQNREPLVIGNPVGQGESFAPGHDPYREPGEALGTRPAKLLAIGRLVHQKDFFNLLEAVSLVRDTREVELTILGDGPKRRALEDKVRVLGLSECVQMPGFVSDPHRWLSACDLFVLPSRFEGFGNVVVESLAAGTPVVATDCGGPRDILSSADFGLLVEKENHTALAAGILEALCKSWSPDRLRARSRDYGVEVIATRYLQAFDDFASRRSNE